MYINILSACSLSLNEFIYDRRLYDDVEKKKPNDIFGADMTFGMGDSPHTHNSDRATSTN